MPLEFSSQSITILLKFFSNTGYYRKSETKRFLSKIFSDNSLRLSGCNKNYENY